MSSAIGTIKAMKTGVECPGCGRTIFPVRGQVPSHVGWDAKRCTVERVDPGVPGSVESDDVADEGTLKREAVTPPRKKGPAKTPKQPRIACDRCGKTLAQTRSGSLPAHQWPNGQWCKGGEKPSEKRLEKVRRKRALRVTVVRGGLPGTSRRH